MTGKWNYKTHEYDDYNPKFKIIMRAKLEDRINCSSCGTRTEFGKCYTSREIHNSVGLGYPVCQKCYDLELEREQNDIKKKGKKCQKKKTN